MVRKQAHHYTQVDCPWTQLKSPKMRWNGKAPSIEEESKKDAPCEGVDNRKGWSLVIPAGQGYDRLDMGVEGFNEAIEHPGSYC